MIRQRRTGSARLGAAALTLLIISGCTVGPDYQQPRVDAVSDTVWIEAPASDDRGAAEPASLTAWWARFGDAELTGLVERALDANLDLAEARERVNAARARRGIRRAEGLPRIDFEAGYTRQDSGDEAAFTGTPDGDLFSSGAVASWEIDLWGRVARLVEEADARIDAASAEADGVRLAVAAEVAAEVLLIRSLDERIAVVRRSMVIDAESIAIAGARARAGNASELDLVRAQRVAASNRAALEPLAAERRASEHRVALLLGVRPGDVSVAASGTPAAPDLPALGVPADLIGRRPDIRRAERELAASVARIGSATAERFPRVTLAGSFRLGGPDGSDAFSLPTRVVSGGPSVTLPVFQGGRIRAAIEEAESDSRAAMIRLEQRVLTAIGEVETALLRRARADREVAELRAAAEAAADAERLAGSLYRAGRTDFLAVLEAQSARLAIDDGLARALLEQHLQTVNLYRALGGGWDAEAS